jgi:hypothetical protein
VQGLKKTFTHKSLHGVFRALRANAVSRPNSLRKV